MAKPRPKLVDLARLAGVSRSTASRALVDSNEISPTTRARVLQVAHQIGYVRNYQASKLGGSSKLVFGMLIRSSDGAFYNQLARDVQEELDSHGIDLLIVNGIGDRERQTRAVTILAERDVDGIIVASGRVEPKILESFAPRIPISVIGYGESIPGINSCAIDPAVTSQLAQLVASLGHQKVAVSSSDPAVAPTLYQRSQLMQQTLREQGVQTATFPYIPDAQQVAEPQISELLAAGYTAIMAGEDNEALLLLELLQRQGRRIPQDVSVTGFDGVGYFASPLLGITTVKQPTKELAENAVNFLRQGLATNDTPAPIFKLIPGQLVMGRTLAAPA